MITTLTTLFSVLTSGAGGGIVGGIFGLFKQSQERKERIAMAEVNLKRDEMEYKNASAEREHNLIMLEKGAKLELELTQTEAEAEAEIANQNALAIAQTSEFKNLNTSTNMDNLRASVRPMIAYWACLLFTIMISWVFYKFNQTITEEVGGQILLALFSTLTFVITSVTSFYYVSRRNSRPQL